MKNLKKIISICLALAIVLTVFSSTVLVSSAETNAVVETIKADLTKSVRIKSKNNSGTEVLSLTQLKNGVVRANAAPGWKAIGDVGSVTWSEAILSLNTADGEFIYLDPAYKYVINVKYTVTSANNTQIGIVRSKDGNPYDYSKGFDVLAGATQTAVGAYTLSSIVDGHEYRTIHLAFGNSGKIAIESVELERVAIGAEVKTVNYVDNGRTTKGFATTSLKTPEFQGALHAVFGGWYTDSALTSVATDITDGATYYAKWRSVTREVDLGNANRMANYNNGEDKTVLNITPNTKNNTVTAVVNQSIGGNIYNGGNGHNDNKQQITLEYADYDDLVQDGIYNNYVTMQSGKQYGITVKFAVTAVSSKAQISVVSAGSNLSYDSTSQICAVNSNITSTGNYTLFAKTGSNGFIDCTYGGSAANDKLRLAFEGNGTFVIESVTIQEIYTADVNGGLAVVVNGSDTSFASAYKVAAVKDLNGSWQIPQPAKDSHIDAQFGGWYTDSAYTSAVVTPEFNTTYYAKWSYAKTDVDLSNLNLMAGGSTAMTITKPTDTTGFVADFDLYNQNLFADGSFTPNSTAWLKSTSVSLEYFDNDPQEQDIIYNGYVATKTGYKYVVNVKYNVTEASQDTKYYPQIAVISNATNLSENAVSTVYGAKKHTKTGDGYTLTAVVNGAAAGQKLRLAFGGVGVIEVESIEIIEYFANDGKYATVTYVDGSDEETVVVENGTETKTLAKADAVFKGWYTSSDFSGEAVNAIASDVKLYAKWVAPSSYDIVRTESTSPDNLVGASDAVSIAMSDNQITTGSYNGYKLSVNNWKMYRPAFFFLTEKNGTKSSFTTKAGAKYIVDMEYDVLATSGGYPLEVGLFGNIGSNGQTESAKWLDNGEYKTYNYSADVQSDRYTVVFTAESAHNVALIFYGQGKITLKDITIKEVPADAVSDYPTVIYIDGDEKNANFANNGDVVPTLPRTATHNFGGWYNGSEKVDTISSDVVLTAKWFEKSDVNMDDVTNLKDLVCIKKALVSTNANILFDIDRDDKVAATDTAVLRKKLLGVAMVGDLAITDFAVVSGAYESYMMNVAVETLESAIKVSDDESSENKIYVGIKDIDEEVLNNEALIDLTGVKGDVYGLDDYKIFMYENDIYIEAGSDYATVYAVNVFVDYVKNNKSIPMSFEISGTYAKGDTKGEVIVDGYQYMVGQGDEFNGGSAYGDNLNKNRWYLTNKTKQGTNYAKDNDYYIDSRKSLANSDASDDFGGPWIDPDGNPNMQDGTIKYIDEEGNNYKLENGLLVMNTKRVEDGYTATEINGTQQFKYGIMTARVKLATKNGATSTVWARTTDDNGASVNEFDFVENYGSDQVIPNLHIWNNYDEDTNLDGKMEKQDVIYPAENESLSDSFHDITLYWTEETIEFYFDGVLYLKQDITDKETYEAFHKTTHMILGVSVPSNYYADAEGKNGSKPGDIMGSLINSFSENMYIDYIRVFQK